jgi:hypothetical protein
VQAIRGRLDGLEQGGPVLRREGDVRLAQTRGRGLDTGERGSQVVSNGGQQGGAHLVSRLRLRSGLRLLGEASTLERRAGRLGEGGQQPLVLREQCRTVEEMTVVGQLRIRSIQGSGTSI